MGRTLRIPFGMLILTTLLSAGCGKDSTKMTPVKGTVYHRGSPVRGGTIVFAPDPDRGNNGAIAHSEIGEDGTFTLRTDGEYGAVPGWHRVSIAGSSLPARFSDPDLSQQSHEIKPGIVNTIDIRLE